MFLVVLLLVVVLLVVFSNKNKDDFGGHEQNDNRTRGNPPVEKVKTDVVSSRPEKDIKVKTDSIDQEVVTPTSKSFSSSVSISPGSGEITSTYHEIDSSTLLPTDDITVTESINLDDAVCKPVMNSYKTANRVNYGLRKAPINPHVGPLVANLSSDKCLHESDVTGL